MYYSFSTEIDFSAGATSSISLVLLDPIQDGGGAKRSFLTVFSPETSI